nr:YeeE/YedE family protein [Bacteriovorax sp. HI3]
MKAYLAAFLAGALFALGLGVSGMTRPDIVQGFLDPFGNWNPSLIGVMVGAILVFSIAYRLITKRPKPLWSEAFSLPTKKDIDYRLILGAIVFGLGWGWAGICPGPGLVSLVSGHGEFFIFVAAMLIGMRLYMWIEKNWLS